MKKITKIASMFSVLLVISTSLSAAPGLLHDCFRIAGDGGVEVEVRVPEQAAGALEAAGWVCVCNDPPHCGSGEI